MKPDEERPPPAPEAEVCYLSFEETVRLFGELAMGSDPQAEHPPQEE